MMCLISTGISLPGSTFRAPAFLFAALALCGSTGFGQSNGTVRIPETDPSIIYTGQWYSNTNSEHSGGVAALTNAKNAQAMISFNGTGITWVGVTDPYAGVAWLYLDGVLSTVDTYAPNTNYQQPLFEAHGLAAGLHTLSIQVTHMRDADGSGSWVWIDSFLIENGTATTGGIAIGPGRTEQNSPGLIYTGDWFLNTNPVMSGGSAALAVDSGSSVTVNFKGSGINWIGYRDQWSGIAHLFLDGTQQPDIDTYLSPAQAQTVAYSVSGLTPGVHTLMIQVTGTRDAASGGSWVWVDAFDVIQ
jgi:hypothetical protein